MGEATYYLKARFPEPVTTKLITQILDFLVQTGEASQFWQNHRHEKSETFWPEFKDKFPLTTKYLKDATTIDPDNPNQDCNNALAGIISFGSYGSPEEVKDGLHFTGDVITYSEETWHLASWDELCNFLASEFGATRTNWLSDEYADLAELLEV